LGELKVADIALRDPTLLGNSRALIPELSTAGKRGADLVKAELALDRTIVDMVTRNPAATVRLIPFAGLAPDNKLNLERLTLTPLLEDDDEFFFDVLGARIDQATGLLVDSAPPFKLYQSNPNQLQRGLDPLGPDAYEDRWYPLPRIKGQKCVANKFGVVSRECVVQPFDSRLRGGEVGNWPRAPKLRRSPRLK
jgi:hypothetical protein